jgi:caa(3)-type oxidase subunit IV
MNALANRWDRCALVLLVATATTFIVSGNHELGHYAGGLTLLIAYIKSRLVLLDFMEIHHAPLVWRLVLEGWLLVLTSILLVLYLSDIGKAGAA